MFVLLPVKTALADSPVTSTAFHQAYLDVPIVQSAVEAGYVTEVLAEFLADEAAPLDIRAAVINAIGWEDGRGGRAESFVKFAYGQTMEELDWSALRGDELLVIGYLLALDDYMDTTQAEALLLDARRKLETSFTAAIVHAIVKSQGPMLPSTWEEAWKIAAAVVHDDRLQMDMRPEAAEIIFDYMGLYSGKKLINPFSAENRLTLREGEPTFTLNGGTFRIDPQYDASPVRRGGQVYLPVRFLTEIVGGNVHWESGTNRIWANAPGARLEFAIGSGKVVVNGEERMLDNAPFVRNGRTMLPYRFIAEALGFDASWDERTKEITLSRYREASVPQE